MSGAETPPQSNVAAGQAFAALAKRELQQRFGFALRAEVPLEIGKPAKAHKFDLGNRERHVAVECKAFTWTVSGNVPSAKITTAREALLYLQWLSPEWTKVLAMAQAVHPKQHESLANYFVRLNRHLLGEVVVVEIIEGSVSVLAGELLESRA